MTDAPKRAPGRPIVHDEPRTKQVLFRVSESEWQALESAAGPDQSVPSFCRDRAIESVGDDPVGVNLAELAELRRRVQQLEAWRDRVCRKADDLAEAVRQPVPYGE